MELLPFKEEVASRQAGAHLALLQQPQGFRLSRGETFDVNFNSENLAAGPAR